MLASTAGFASFGEWSSHYASWGAANGLRGVLMSAIPPDAGVPPLWHPYYDPLWAVCQDTGLPLNQHGGSGLPDLSEAEAENFLMLMEVGFAAQRSLWHMILGGAFERFPDLKMVITENRVNWVPEKLQRMDGLWTFFQSGGIDALPIDTFQLAEPPSAYFHRNCFIGASFASLGERDSIRALGPAQARLAKTEDAKEGVRSFVDRRPGRFAGR